MNRSIQNWLCPGGITSVFPVNSIYNDIDFRDALSENSNNEINVSLTELNEKIFNPFELNEYTSVSPLIDVDPDLQYYNSMSNEMNNCDYHLEETFNKKCIEQIH